MKLRLLVLIAVIALPTTVNAESYWLIVFLKAKSSQKMQMNSMEQCKEQGEAYKDSGIYGRSEMSKSMRYVCLKGK